MINHVVSLELAKQLKEKGFKINNYFYHTRVGEGHAPEILNKHIMNYIEPIGNYRIPTYLATELLEVMPKSIYDKNGNKYYLSIKCSINRRTSNDNYYVDYDDETGLNITYEVSSTLPDALAKMIIWLIDNQYIEVQDGTD